MSKRNTVSVTILSAFALTLCLFSTVITAQKDPKVVAVPLEGVNISLARIGDLQGQVVAINQTNKDGHFKFPVLPAGSYSLTLSRSKLFTDKNGEGTIEKVGPANQAAMPANTCSITILGAEGGTKTEDWNLATGRIIIKSHNGVATRATPGEDKITVISDGQTPLNGTISKSRSNVKTN